MTIPGFMAKQLGHPSGWFGRYVMGRFLNRTTAVHNGLVRRELAVCPGDRVLEVGFGGAALLERLGREAAPGLAAGVEISEEMLARAAKRLRKAIAAGCIVLKRGSAGALPFDDAEFDKACTVNTIYFWPDLVAGFSELGRVLRPGGRLVTGFDSAEDLVRAGLHRQGFACYPVQQVELALVDASFEVSQLRTGTDAWGMFHVITAIRAE